MTAFVTLSFGPLSYNHGENKSSFDLSQLDLWKAILEAALFEPGPWLGQIFTVIFPDFNDFMGETMVTFLMLIFMLFFLPWIFGRKKCELNGDDLMGG